MRGACRVDPLEGVFHIVHPVEDAEREGGREGGRERRKRREAW